MEQFKYLDNFNVNSLSNIWTSDELKIEPSHYGSNLDLEFFKGINLENMAKAVQLYMKLYFRRYVINRAFNGRVRESVNVMIAVAQHYLRYLCRHAELMSNKLLITEV
eukprot:TRINITY_DN1842_c0_g1_i4.p1 TRINITY_DN1842_c0_g1~~TRINITY_DN1842_c0_g1_i4.p1  ORF type:complete len:108 (-),score=18.48 TRINITY_DN1842_c0_g1_i4:79-402(-)